MREHDALGTAGTAGRVENRRDVGVYDPMPWLGRSVKQVGPGMHRQGEREFAGHFAGYDQMSQIVAVSQNRAEQR